MKNTSLSGIDLNNTEFCVIVGNQYYKNNTFKIKIPKLMPYANTKNSISFNKNILVNDSSNKPSSSSSVATQDYITVERSPMCNLICVSNSNNMIPDGTVVKCTCRNGDYKKIIIVDA